MYPQNGPKGIRGLRAMSFHNTTRYKVEEGRKHTSFPLIMQLEMMSNICKPFPLPLEGYITTTWDDGFCFN